MVLEHFQPPPFHPDRPSLVAPVRVDPTGRDGPTRGQAGGPYWRRSSHGLYVPADAPDTVQQRIVEAGALLPRDGAVTGWAALHWWGSRWIDGTMPGGGSRSVELALSSESDIRSQAGVTTRRERWNWDDVEVVDGLRVTSAARSLAFAMRYADGLWHAVLLADMAAYDDLVSMTELSNYAGRAPRQGLSSWRGIPQCREAALLGNENSWSPREVWLRLVWQVVAGLPPPLMNHPVFDLRGRRLGTPDLLDVESGTVGQYDGSLHAARAERARDAERDEVFRAVGLETFRVVTGETAGAAAMRMRDVRTRAMARSSEPRAWTAEPPRWWIPTATVAQRRALTTDQRRWLLRHRRAA